MELGSGLRKRLAVAQFLGMTESKKFCFKIAEGQREWSMREGRGPDSTQKGHPAEGLAWTVSMTKGL